MTFGNRTADESEDQSASRAYSRDGSDDQAKRESGARASASPKDIVVNDPEIGLKDISFADLPDGLAERILEADGYEQQIAWVKKPKRKKSNKKYRDKKKKQGIDQVNVEAPIIWHDLIKEFAKYTCSCLERGLPTGEMISGAVAALEYAARQAIGESSRNGDMT